MTGRYMKLPDGAYCPVCGKWIPDASNFKEDWEQDEVSTVMECEYCELEFVIYSNPIQQGEKE